MINRPVKRKAKNKAFIPILSHLKKHLYYIEGLTFKLDITKKEAIDIFLDLIGTSHIDKNKQDVILEIYYNKSHPLLQDNYIKKLRRLITPEFKKRFKEGKYQRYLRSPQWQEKRRQLFLERGRLCESCGLDMEELNIEPDVHHKTYATIYREKLEHLQVLCRKCHNKKHNK